MDALLRGDIQGAITTLLPFLMPVLIFLGAMALIAISFKFLINQLTSLKPRSRNPQRTRNHNTPLIRKAYDDNHYFDDDYYTDDKTYSYSPRKLFTASEFAFFKALEPYATKNSLLIFPKIRIADIAQTNEIYKSREWQIAFNQISQKHVDFILCEKDSLKIKYIIELDDPSHNLPERQNRDTFVDNVMEQCGYKIFHVRTGEQFNFSMLQNMTQNANSNTEKI